MSRVGKYPVPVPAGVQVALQGRTVVAKGKLGELKLDLTDEVDIEIANNQVAVKPRRDDRRSRTMWGTTRSLINGMCVGVSTGFTKSLEIIGVGYRATAKGDTALDLALGFSHPVSVVAPAGITFEVPAPTQILVKGTDKETVGQVAADIRAIRKPEPYKGKGVRYKGEYVARKAGKAGK
jgi:large subunit ribosomal protein L6